MQIEVNKQILETKQINGRYYHVFTPRTPNDLLKIKHMGCMGDTQIRDVQVELGEMPSSYEPVSVETYPLSGLYDAIQGVRIELNDPNSPFWSQIKANNEAMLIKFERDKLSTQIGVTADTIRQEIKDALDGKISTFTQNVNGFRQRVEDSMSQSTRTQIAQAIEDKVTRQDVTSIIRSSGDNILFAVKDKGADLVSTINLTKSGVQIKGSLINLDGTTKMTNAFANNLIASQFTADNLKALTAQINQLSVINLDIKKLTGMDASFLRILLDGVKSSVKLDGRELAIMRTDNTYAAKFHENGVTLFRDGVKVGSLMSLDAIERYGYYNNKKSISLTTEPGSYVGLSYYSSNDGNYYRAVALGGDGRLRLHSELYAGITNHGFGIHSSSIKSNGITLKGTLLADTVTGKGLLVTEDNDSWLPLRTGHYTSITDIRDDINALRVRVRSLESRASSSSSSSSTYTPPSTTPTPSQPVKKSLQVGSIVKLKSGVTQYYDENDRLITIPTNKNGYNYRTLTYTIGKIATNSRVAPYCIYYDGWAIAWVKEDMVNIQ